MQPGPYYRMIFIQVGVLKGFGVSCGAQGMCAVLVMAGYAIKS